MIKVLVLSLIATNALGQAPGEKALLSVPKKDPDTTLKVVYANEKIHPGKKPPAYFINGGLVDETTFKTFDFKNVDSLQVLSTNSQSDSNKYYGEMHIKTKGAYNPHLISLTALREKYTNVKNRNVLFMLNGVFINEYFDQSMVDEDYILRIIVEPAKNLKENISLFVINLVTGPKTDRNKINEIRIRGNNSQQTTTGVVTLNR